jgi:thiol-disulfide isomerase/thioredoxin
MPIMKVVKIGAEWCSGCVVMGPRWKKVEEENPWVVTEYYDYDNSPDIVEKYNLEQAKLPCFIFLDKDGAEIDRKAGELSVKEITSLILKYKDQ